MKSADERRLSCMMATFKVAFERCEDTRVCLFGGGKGAEANDDCSGRRAELEALERMFFGRRICRRAAIIELGGIGKTQVALSIACSVWQRRSDFSMFWVPAVSDEMMAQAFEEMAGLLEFCVRSGEPESALDVVCRHLKAPAAGRWLMIVHIAEETKVLDGDAESAGLLALLATKRAGTNIVHPPQARGSPAKMRSRCRDCPTKMP